MRLAHRVTEQSVSPILIAASAQGRGRKPLLIHRLLQRSLWAADGVVLSNVPAYRVVGDILDPEAWAAPAARLVSTK